jgi:hypothetical protein
MPYRIVFDAYHLYHLPQFDPVIDLLLQDDRFEVFLTTSSDNLIDEQVLTQRILRRRGATCIFADSEDERARKIRELDPAISFAAGRAIQLKNLFPKKPWSA